ncbi:hypothetical protein KX816_02915 [Sphingosinicellaceae bacterium]|nr:hypothetical protein KX816_02915 [Sphingosinicellaceae bacterium]
MSDVTGAAFWAGFDARLKGAPESSCPFAQDTGKYREWQEGWNEQPPASDVTVPN